MEPKDLASWAVAALEDMKAQEITVCDVRRRSDVTDYMVLCSATSTQHAKSLADHVWREAKKQGIVCLGVEGQTIGEWVLLDFGPVVVHVLMPALRDYYQLEDLWKPIKRRKKAVGHDGE